MQALQEFTDCILSVQVHSLLLPKTWFSATKLTLSEMRSWLAEFKDTDEISWRLKYLHLNMDFIFYPIVFHFISY